MSDLTDEEHALVQWIAEAVPKPSRAQMEYKWKRRAEAAEARARLEGAEIMREAAAERLRTSCFYSSDDVTKRVSFMTARDFIRNLDPATILEAHRRAKAMDEQAGDGV